MRKLYVDTENITDYDFLKNLNLDSTDELILFLSNRSKNLNPSNVDSLINLKANKKTVLIHCKEKNAMDFQIVAYLGVTYTKEDYHYIVSNDKGYKSALDCFSTQFGYKNIKILNEKFSTNDIEDIKLESLMSKDILSMIDELEKKYSIHKENVFEIIKKSKDLSSLHANLVKTYKDKGRDMYKTFKKIYKTVLV